MTTLKTQNGDINFTESLTIDCKVPPQSPYLEYKIGDAIAIVHDGKDPSDWGTGIITGIRLQVFAAYPSSNSWLYLVAHDSPIGGISWYSSDDICLQSQVSKLVSDFLADNQSDDVN